MEQLDKEDEYAEEGPQSVDNTSWSEVLKEQQGY